MKVKLKNKNNPIPISDSYKGLNTDVHSRLNAGYEVEVAVVPEAASEFVVEVKEKPKATKPKSKRK